MTSSARVSVAIATYNGASYIKEQLDSILTQTYLVYEIIIVDDCSSDETWNILVQYATNNSKIKIFRNETNLGGTKSFEKTICACRGDYIALADQDDVWLPEKIATLIEQIGDNWLIHSDAFVVDANLNVLHRSYSSLKSNLNGDFVKYLIMNDVTGCTVLFSRQLVEKCFPIPDGYYVHDHYLALMASFFNKITYCDKPLIFYRQHSANQIGSSKLKDYAAWQKRSLDFVNSCNALLSTKTFERNLDVRQALSYYEARLNAHHASLSVYLWSYKHFGLTKTMEYLAMTLFGSFGARLIFKLIRS
jgi:glycosyltransferase involved in cell wall biosynthesis